MMYHCIFLALFLSVEIQKMFGDSLCFNRYVSSCDEVFPTQEKSENYWWRSSTEIDISITSLIGFHLHKKIQNWATTSHRHCMDLCRASSSVWNAEELSMQRETYDIRLKFTTGGKEYWSLTWRTKWIGAIEIRKLHPFHGHLVQVWRLFCRVTKHTQVTPTHLFHQGQKGSAFN